MSPNPPTAAEPQRSFDESSRAVFCLSLRSHAEIGVMARVVQALARRSLLPSRWHSVEAGEQLLMDLHIPEISAEEGELLAAALGQIVGVEEVLTSRFLRLSAA
jgi:hypothetical protein